MQNPHLASCTEQSEKLGTTIDSALPEASGASLSLRPDSSGDLADNTYGVNNPIRICRSLEYVSTPQRGTSAFHGSNHATRPRLQSRHILNDRDVVLVARTIHSLRPSAVTHKRRNLHTICNLGTKFNVEWWSPPRLGHATE